MFGVTADYLWKLSYDEFSAVTDYYKRHIENKKHITSSNYK